MLRTKTDKQKNEQTNKKKTHQAPSHENTWENCKCVLLSERSQSEKTTYCMCNSLEKANYEEVKRMVVTKD